MSASAMRINVVLSTLRLKGWEALQADMSKNALKNVVLEVTGLGYTRRVRHHDGIGRS